MKTNFRNVLIVATALALGFSSCSSDNETTIDPNGIVPNGEMTTARITLTQTQKSGAQTYAGNNAATTEEAQVKTATVYAFNAANVFAGSVTFAAGATNGTISLQTGTNYFYIVANASPAVTAGLGVLAPGVTTRADFEKAAVTLNAMGDIVVDPAGAGTGYVMTNTEGGVQANLTAAANTVAINIGRAFAKTNVEFPATVTQPASGALSAVQYMIIQSPKAMNLMPNYVGNQLQSAYWLKSVAAVDPIVTDYFNSGTITIGGVFPNQTYTFTGMVAALPAAGNKATYTTENSNKDPKDGNITTALLQGQFIPTQTLDAAGADPQAGVAGGDFWRIAVLDNLVATATKVESYGDAFYRIEPTTAITDFETANPAAAGKVIAMKYEAGNAFYFVKLADNTVIGNTPLKYTVARNHYFHVAISKVNGCGAPTPVIVEPTNPVEVDVNITANITVSDWTLHDQLEEI